MNIRSLRGWMVGPFGRGLWDRRVRSGLEARDVTALRRRCSEELREATSVARRRTTRRTPCADWLTSRRSPIFTPRHAGWSWPADCRTSPGRSSSPVAPSCLKPAPPLRPAAVGAG
jgi:hypothetical protein